jgi:hypothetical protein
MTIRTTSIRGSLLILSLAGFAVISSHGNSEDAAANKPASAAATKVKNDSPYAGYRSWKPVNPEPKLANARDLRDCRGPLPEERGSPHMDGFINVYVSEAGREAYLKGMTKELPEGTVIVKEKLVRDAKQPTELGVMIKREKDFAPKSGDWQYIFVDAKGTVTDQQSKLKNCAACHRLREKNDYVFRAIVPVAEKGNQAPSSRK